MIEFVTHGGRAAGPAAQDACQGHSCRPSSPRVPEIAPILRGAVALEKNALAGTAKRQILDFRTNPQILDYVNGAELARYSQRAW